MATASESWRNVPLVAELFHGAVDLEVAADGSVQPWRIPLEHKELFFDTADDSGLLKQARCPSGVRLVLRSDTCRVRLTTAPTEPLAPYDFDLRCDGELHATICRPAAVSLGEGDEAGGSGGSGGGGGGGGGGGSVVPLLRERLPAYFAEAAKVRERARSGEFALPELVIEFDGLPGPAAAPRLLELWLSNVGPQWVRRLEVDASCTVCETLARPRARAGGCPSSTSGGVWITHGSSITHNMGFDSGGLPGLPYGSGSALSPSRTWPALAARAAGLSLVSLGFGGQCCMDPMMARTIRDMEADAISLKLGINVHNHGAMGLRSFAQAALGFLLTVREGHPTTPLLIISPIFGAWRETMSHSALLVAPDRGAADARFPTLQQMRGELSRVVALLQRRGDRHIQYLDGRELFGAADMEQGLMPDELHPCGEGYELMGQRFAQAAFGPDGKLLPGRVQGAARL